jgi:hypothetical protein
VAISLYADCVMAAGAVWCTGCAVAAVKRFADACRRGEEGIARGVVCPEDEESVRRRKGVVASLVEVELRRS